MVPDFPTCIKASNIRLIELAIKYSGTNTIDYEEPIMPTRYYQYYDNTGPTKQEINEMEHAKFLESIRRKQTRSRF